MIITRTPFRISFFGGGTDYPAWFRKHGGAVLSTSIDKYCYLTVRYLPPFFEHRHRVVYSIVEMVREIEEIKHPVVRAVLSEMGFSRGLEIHHDGDLPARSGLGSSSSFAVGIINALSVLEGRRCGKKELAQEAIRLEQDILKESVGCQDQICAAFGGLNRIEFTSSDEFSVMPLELDAERYALLEGSLMLFFTGLTRMASNVAKEKIKNLKNRENELKTMRSLVDHAQGVMRNSSNLVEEIGALLHENWLLKRSLTESVSNPLVNEIYQAGLDAGALGGKLLGAGGGGFMIFVVRSEDREKVRDCLRDLIHVEFKFETEGSKILVCEPDLNG